MEEKNVQSQTEENKVTSQNKTDNKVSAEIVRNMFRFLERCNR